MILGSSIMMIVGNEQRVILLNEWDDTVFIS